MGVICAGKEDVAAGMSSFARRGLANESDGERERKVSTLGSFLDNKPATREGRSKLLPNFTKAALETSLPSALADRISDASGNLNSLGNLNTLRRGMNWVGDLGWETPKHIRQLSGGGGAGREGAEAEREYEVELHVLQESGMMSATLCLRWDSMVLRSRKDGKDWVRSVHVLDILLVTTGHQGSLNPQQQSRHAVDAGLREAQLLTVALVSGSPLTLSLATREEASRCARRIERRWREFRVLTESVLEGNLLLLLPDGSWGVRRLVLSQDSLACYPYNLANLDSGEASCARDRLLHDAKHVQIFPLSSISDVEAWADVQRSCCLRITIGSELEGWGQVPLMTRASSTSQWGHDSTRETRVLVLDCLLPREARRWGDALQRSCGDIKEIYVWGQWGGFDDGGGREAEAVMSLQMPPLAKAKEKDRDRDPQAGAHSCAVAQVGRIPVPSEVPGLQDQRVVGVACGNSHGLAVMQDGCVWAWGGGARGQLGRGDDHPSPEPVALPALARGGVRQVACGGDSSMAVTGQGALLVWGDVSWCRPSAAHRACPDAAMSVSAGACSAEQRWEDLVAFEYEPRVMRVAGGIGVWEVSCGLHHAALVLVDGRLMTWGVGFAGQLGLGDLLPRCAPCHLDVSSVEHQRGRAWKVSCGTWHSAAISEYGHVITWGGGHEGQLGHGDKAMCMVPKTVRGLVIPSDSGEADTGPCAVDEAVCHVSCAQTHTIALTVTGHAFVWGKGPDGQLGLGPHATSSYSPANVPGLSGLAYVAAGCKQSTALTRSGDLYCWGLGVCLGADLEEGKRKLTEEYPANAQVAPSFEPQKISARLSGRVEQVACGGAWCAVVCCKDSTPYRLDSHRTATDRSRPSPAASRPLLPPGLLEVGDGSVGEGAALEELRALELVLESATLLAQQRVISSHDLEEQKRQVFQSKLCHWIEATGAPLHLHSLPRPVAPHDSLRPIPYTSPPGGAGRAVRKTCDGEPECSCAARAGETEQDGGGGGSKGGNLRCGAGEGGGRGGSSGGGGGDGEESGHVSIQEAANKILSALALANGDATMGGDGRGLEDLEEAVDAALSALQERRAAQLTS